MFRIWIEITTIVITIIIIITTIILITKKKKGTMKIIVNRSYIMILTTVNP
jgi:hypothetical protein